MRFINAIYTAEVGEPWNNTRLLPIFERSIQHADLDAAHRQALLDFVHYQMIGDRVRRTVVPNWTPASLRDFKSRASRYESGADDALGVLAGNVLLDLEPRGIELDAVLTTTSTGNLMPGLSYRIARRLGRAVRQDSLLLDLGNVGCTGSSKAINLALSLDASMKNVLVVAVEAPTTMVDVTATDFDVWQGNCTFGDGAAALWISVDPEQGPLALAIELLRYSQFAKAGLGLIRWAYRNYYSFAVAEQEQFESEVQRLVLSSLEELRASWEETPLWAIHPAGISLLMRLSRRLGITKQAIKPSADHYHEHSNMSSASLLFVLQDVAANAPQGACINLLTMGAGFNTIYGRLRRVR